MGMDMDKIVERAKRNIWQAIVDYKRHTNQAEMLDDITDAFVDRLALDSTYAKQNLRELFSKSPVWNEDLDALVINGTRTNNPDYNLAYRLAFELLERSGIDRHDIHELALFFSTQGLPDVEKDRIIRRINEIAPDAYKPGKKMSRVFRSFCIALGIYDETPNSEFQRKYAVYADTLSAKKLDFKLFASINPAHFLTMSNPKGDIRGSTLTSCHSLNCTDYEYNNGCSGYARAATSFIVFTVKDPEDLETLNNRKTTRQVFAYEPGNGVLLQSRLYNTSGGVRGAAEETPLYRDIIQREISMLEDRPNLWKTYSSTGEHSCDVEIGNGFGGYPDWNYSSFDGKISIRNDMASSYKKIIIGERGLCISCGRECSDGLYCNDCNDTDIYTCEDCGCRCDTTYEVYDENGNEIEVCEDCYDNHYSYCYCCDAYNHIDAMVYIEREDIEVCRDCLDRNYTVCDRCGEYVRIDDSFDVIGENGLSVTMCEDCFGDVSFSCSDCGVNYVNETKVLVYTDEDVISVCPECAKEYDVCPHCGERISRKGESCPNCGCVIENEEEDAA